MSSNNNVECIANFAEEIVRKMRVFPRACLYCSSMLAAMINDSTSMQAVLSVGSLQICGRTIFRHSPIKPILDSGKNVIAQWSGHAWVTIDGLICDLSLFQAVASEISSHEIKMIIENMFPNSPTYLIGQETKLREIEVIYSPEEILDDKHVTMLIQNAERLGLL